MSVVVDEPEIYVIKPDEGIAAEYRARRERDQADARHRYIKHLVPRLEAINSAGDAEAQAAAIVDALTVWPSVVDGHSFYFRVRHDDWSIQIDLQGTGRVAQVWAGGALDDEADLEPREIQQGGTRLGATDE